MLPAIDLDDQSCLMADEVGNEPADRHLSAKPIAFGLPRPQHLPELLFGFGHVTAEVPGALARTGAWRFLHHGSFLGLTPTRPSPIEGEGVTGCLLARARNRLRPAPGKSRPIGLAPRRARLGFRQADAADRLRAARNRLMCCRASRSFADLLGDRLPYAIISYSAPATTVVDRDRQSRSAQEYFHKLSA